MTPEIESVMMGKSGYHPMALPTSGVYTCVAVMTLLHDDPTKIRSHLSSVDTEAQDFIEQIHQYKPNVAINAVFLIGGYNNNSYRQLS
jgi:hypothetical protein